MISKSLSTSEKFAGLVSSAPGLAEFCHALYPLIVTHTDDFGRLQGDPFTVKHQCYPASARSLDEFAAGLQAMHDIELLIWYPVGGKRYIQIVQFERHQQGLHKRTRSGFPRVPGSSGNDEEIPGQLKGRELKRTKGKGTKGKEKHGPQQNAGGTPTPTRQAFEHYHRRFLARYGVKPEYGTDKSEHSKHAGNMARLLRKHDLAQVTSRIDAYFDSEDKFVSGSGHPLGLFFSSDVQTKLIAQMNRRGSGDFRCMSHEPPCRDASEHTKRDIAAAKKLA